MLVINNLALAYGGRTLFSEVSLNLSARRRYGVVGANGCGKSTLLRVLSGVESASGGTIDVVNRGKIGFLQQDHFKYEHDLIVEVVLQGRAELWHALKEKEELLKRDHFDEQSGMRLAQLEHTIAEQDGYTAETLAQAILSGLGIPEEKQYEQMHILSGGFKLRVLLAQTLFGNPDILLLDEPTNHLDIAAIAWLEDYLINSYKGVLVIVSHDHTFLNNLATSILDVDYGTITEYKGNFDAFVAAKDLAAQQRDITAKEQERKIEHMQAFVDKFKAKASKARQAQSRMKMIDKIEIADVQVSSRQAPNFQFLTRRPSGKQVLKVENIEKSFAENKILKKIKFEVNRGEKVGIIGQNGIGKSTLLKILMNDLKADHGSFEWGYEAQIGYFSQDHSELLQTKASAYEWLFDQGHQVDDKTLRGYLGRMLFSKDDVQKSINTLSGGEAARLLFANIMLQQPNILVLDEPTNHLDMETIDALGESLKEYQGTLIVVSHDRHFLNKICSRIIVLKHDKTHDYELTHGLSVKQLCEQHFCMTI